MNPALETEPVGLASLDADPRAGMRAITTQGSLFDKKVSMMHVI
jgi:hypothetical protein